MVNLRKLWRMKKKNKRSLQYDIESYSKNFDDGHSSDSDSAYSSFSVRFSVLNSKFSFDKSSEEISSSDDDVSSEISCWYRSFFNLDKKIVCAYVRVSYCKYIYIYYDCNFWMNYNAIREKTISSAAYKLWKFMGSFIRYILV